MTYAIAYMAIWLIFFAITIALPITLIVLLVKSNKKDKETGAD